LCSACAVNAHAGDVVQEDDVIAQIETDKVTIDVKFTAKSGKITQVLVAEGDTVTGDSACLVKQLHQCEGLAVAVLLEFVCAQQLQSCSVEFPCLSLSAGHLL
jgi:hypothetical protein